MFCELVQVILTGSLIPIEDLSAVHFDLLLGNSMELSGLTQPVSR